MKKKDFLRLITFSVSKTITFFALLLTINAAQAQNVTIPDANFKAYLVGNSAINTNGDTEIQISEASAFNGAIDCNTQSIASLSGVEAFTNLNILECSFNPITSLDVSQNLALTRLNCGDMQLTSLDVSQNQFLYELYCGHNQLSSLDVSQNPDLVNIGCAHNQLMSLNLSQNPSLYAISCSSNQLTSLDLSQNPNCGLFACDSNQLECLNV